MSDDDKRVVVDQFTQQAAPFREFAEMPGQPREIVLAATEIKPDDTLLDVACGPGVTTAIWPRSPNTPRASTSHQR